MGKGERDRDIASPQKGGRFSPPKGRRRESKGKKFLLRGRERRGRSPPSRKGERRGITRLLREVFFYRQEREGRSNLFYTELKGKKRKG